MAYFFLSYAAADDGAYIDTFYSDLSEAVRVRTGVAPNDIGFRDRTDIPLGDDWMDDLSKAVASARVFVALCSPSYFASDFCGREWQAFADRGAPHRRGASDPPVGLLPVVWARSEAVPDVAKRLQNTHQRLGETYRREGLRYLMKLRRFRDEYTAFVEALAERIVAVGGSQPSEPDPPAVDLRQVESAFATSPRSAPSRRTPIRRRVPDSTEEDAAAFFTSSRGPQHVHFVIVAAPTHALSQVRSDTQFYGPGAYDWAPYKPHTTQRICVFAQSIACNKDLTSALETAERSVVDLLERARRKNEIVVLLVDIWTATLEPYRGVLNEYDRLNEPTSAVMVPWNVSDEELVDNAEMLHRELYRTFPANVTRQDTVFRPQIRTLEDFESTLEELLTEAQSRIFQSGEVRRRAGGSRQLARPLLLSPDPDATS